MSSQGTHPDYTVKIYFRILRDGEGNGGYDITKLPDVISILDDAFNPHGIYFEYVCEKNYLDNQNLADNGSSGANFCLWSEIPRAADGITIYIAKGFELLPGYRGRASGITGDFMVLQEGVGNNNSVIESTTIIHEMGHLFGLFHMFHGSTQNQAIWDHPAYDEICNDDPAGNLCESSFICRYSESFINCQTGMIEVDLLECAEDMTNGGIAGDYIPDTPPSHQRIENEALSFECEGRIDRIVYNEVDGGNPNFPQILDPQGNFYNPDYTNFISIASSPSSLDCRDHFTPNQITVMKNHILGHPNLSHVRVLDPEPRCACTYDSQIFIESPTNWSQVIVDEGLSSIGLADREIVINDKLFLDTDYDFRGVIFRMGPDAEITVENETSISTGISSSSETRTTFMSCSPEKTWDRILVKSGGRLALQDADIYGGTNQIMANNGSALFIDNCVMLEAANYAIQIEGNVQTGNPQEIFCRNTRIRRAKNGILIAQSPNNHLIDNVEIGGVIDGGPALTTNFGIAIFESSATIQNSYVNSDYGFFLLDANGVIIRNNPGIRYNDYGVFAWRSNNLLIGGNRIGDPFYRSQTAINVFNVPSLNISNNKIFAKHTGISAVFTSPLIEDNNITVTPSEGNTATGAIRLAATNGGNIFDNVIDCEQASFGIESSNSTNTEITSNNVIVNNMQGRRTGGIRSLGSHTETIDDNLIEGDLNIGIYIQNSINNTINCNDVKGATEAIGIYQNSQGQIITGNEMIDSELDLTIRSVIGLQEYHGNNFESGTARAVGLGNEEINTSRFLVNDYFTDHMPADPDPANGWFINNPGEFNYETCSGEAGTLSMPPFWQDKNAICTAYEVASNHPASERNFIFQLLSYRQAHSNFILPGCINLENYNMEKDLFMAWNNLLKIAQPTVDIAIREELKNLQREYMETETTIGSENIRKNIAEKLAEFKSSFDTDKISRQNAIRDVDYVLTTITPEAEQLTHWKVILENYTKILASDPFSETEIDWSTSASLCSDRNGSLVHLARIMANQSVAIYYDNFDDCVSAGLNENKNAILAKDPNLLSVIPNPSDGNLQIDFGTVQTGTLSIIDIYGKQVYHNKIKRRTGLQLSLNIIPGIYLIKMKTVNGNIQTRKIIVTK